MATIPAEAATNGTRKCASKLRQGSRKAWNLPQPKFYETRRRQRRNHPTRWCARSQCNDLIRSRTDWPNWPAGPNCERGDAQPHHGGLGDVPTAEGKTPRSDFLEAACI